MLLWNLAASENPVRMLGFSSSVPFGRPRSCPLLSMPSGQPEVLRIGASDARHLSAADRFHVHVEREGADLRLTQRWPQFSIRDAPPPIHRAKLGVDADPFNERRLIAEGTRSVLAAKKAGGARLRNQCARPRFLIGGNSTERKASNLGPGTITLYRSTVHGRLVQRA